MVDEFLTLVKKRLLRWYGYISRSSDTYDKDNSSGDSARSKKRRRDGNIKEWTGMGFKYSPTAAERKGIVATSSVVPRRPSRLKDSPEVLLLWYTFP